MGLVVRSHSSRGPAAKLARESGHELTQTTPHLLAWLDFNGALTGAEKQEVLTQHADLNGS